MAGAPCNGGFASVCCRAARSCRWPAGRIGGRRRRADRFKAGIADPVNTVLALWMAQAGGFYAAQGLKVEIVNMNGGSRGAQELQAGRLDVMHVGLSSVVQLNRAGGDLRLIASLEQRHPLHLLLRAGREDRGRPQGRRDRRQHLRLGERFHRHARAAAAGPRRATTSR